MCTYSRCANRWKKRVYVYTHADNTQARIVHTYIRAQWEMGNVGERNIDYIYIKERWVKSFFFAIYYYIYIARPQLHGN